MPITLPPELEKFIQSQISSGKYASIDEVFLAGIKLLAEREKLYQGRFEELRSKIMIGVEEAEQGELLDSETVISNLQEKFIKHKANVL